MLATTLGVEFNSDTDWNEREDIYKMSGKIVKTFNFNGNIIHNMIDHNQLV